SRRQTRHFGPRSLAMLLDPSPLPRPHAVVRLRGHVLDTQDLEPRGLQRADRRLAAGARALHEHLHLLEAVLHALPRARVGGDLRGERRRLAGALEARRAGRLPCDDVPLAVRERDDRVVEARLDVRLADRDVLADAAARATSGRLTTGRRHLLPLLPAADGLLRALPGARVRLRALPVRRQAAPVTEAAVRTDVGEPLDRLLALAAEVSLDLELPVDVVAELRGGREAERGCDLARRGLADAVDVGQPDLEPLLVREVDSGDACHSLALPLLVPGIAADDHGRAVPLDDAAALAHGLDGRANFHGYRCL